MEYVVVGTEDFLVQWHGICSAATSETAVSEWFPLGFILTLFAGTPANLHWRYPIPIGFIGGYTTFSTFQDETLHAIQDGQVISGLLNVVLSVSVDLAPRRVERVHGLES